MRPSDVVLMVFVISFLFAPFIILYNSIPQMNSNYNSTINFSLSNQAEEMAYSAANYVGGTQNTSLVNIVANLGGNVDPLTQMYNYFSFFIQATVLVGQTLLSFITLPIQLAEFTISLLNDVPNVDNTIIGILSILLYLFTGIFYIWFVFKIIEVVFGKVV